MGSQVSAKTNDKEQQLKKASKMAMVRALLPIVGLVVIFLLFNVLTDFRMMGNMSLAFSQVYVTMIAAMGVFFIMTMGGLDFSGIHPWNCFNHCMYSFKTWNCNCNSWWYCIRCDHRCDQRILLCIP